MFAIIDTETTGGNPAKDRVMEVAILVHDGEKVVDEFNTLINPQSPIAPFIRSLTGIREEMLEDAPTFEEVAERILKMTERNIFVAHNVSFDYSVIRNEFRRMGIRFERKQLCTVKLSRSILPGMNSYSLGKLCKEIGINLEGRHRAYGDAAATAELFSILLKQDKDNRMRSMLEVELVGIDDVPNLDLEVVEELPEDTGVYYFHDQQGKVIYLSKSRNIRKQVIKDLKSEKFKERFATMLDEIYDVSYEITGSELVAQLIELGNIHDHKPRFNPARRKKNYRYGLVYFTNKHGYMQLKIQQLEKMNGAKSLVEFTTRKSAHAVLKRLAEKYSLFPSFCGFESDKNGELPKLPPDIYNQKFNGIFKKYHFKHNNFFIIGDGRSHHEQSAVWIEENQFKGFGFFQPEYIENDIESIKEHVTHHFQATPEIQRIVHNWLSKRNRDTIIPY